MEGRTAPRQGRRASAARAMGGAHGAGGANDTTTSGGTALAGQPSAFGATTASTTENEKGTGSHRAEAAPAAANETAKPFTGVSRRKSIQMSQGEGDAGKGTKAMSRNHERHFDDEGDDASGAVDIMSIPELETEGEQDITKQVADAPKVRSSKVQSLYELDSVNAGIPPLAPSFASAKGHGNHEDGDLGMQSSRQRSAEAARQKEQLASVDLSLLTRHLLPSEYVFSEDQDAVWEVDALTDKASIFSLCVCISYDYSCVARCDAIWCTSVLRPTPRSLSRLTDALWTTSPSPVRVCDLACSCAGARLCSV